MRAAFVLRVRLIAVLIILVASVLVVRLYFLQVVHGQSYAQEADRQYVQYTSELFDRGDIYFTDKHGRTVTAAGLKTGFTVALNPNKVTDVDLYYSKLEPYLEIDKATFYARAGKVDDPYEEVAHRLPQNQVEALESLDLVGVQAFRTQWRHYPGNTLAAQTLGFVGFGAGDTELKGRYGLERYWDDVLRRDKAQLYVNFFAEVFSNVHDVIFSDEKSRAGNIVTSIEPSVQQELERILEETENEWHAKHVIGIIMDPRNGDVLALGARPSFNVNEYSAEDDPRVFSNPLVESVREMGSIVKPIAMAIALDEGVVTPTTTYNDTGSIELDTFTISNYDGGARGVVSMQEVLNQSLNVGMAYVAKEVGNETFGARMRSFGLGEETGIDLPYEAHGLVDNLNSPRDVEYATAAFGQGIALTPIATARALAALGNGGYLVTPHLVQQIEYEHGDTGNVSIDDKKQVLSTAASEEITRMLVTVVDDALRGGAVKKEHYAIAAKTGTAQIAKEGERGYYEDKFLHSFFGYFPAYEPRFLIFLYHIEPQGARYASETLTTPFMDLVDFLINYFEIPPDR
jgi:cell division protein FtsI/penicillin-binding protein 2